MVLAIIGGVLIYFLFVKQDNKKLSDNLKKLKDFLNFKTMIIEPILKVFYLIATIFTVLSSFSFIGTNFLLFILILILGPIVVRLIYEGCLILIMIWKNTKELVNKEKK